MAKSPRQYISLALDRRFDQRAIEHLETYKDPHALRADVMRILEHGLSNHKFRPESQHAASAPRAEEIYTYKVVVSKAVTPVLFKYAMAMPRGQRRRHMRLAFMEAFNQFITVGLPFHLEEGDHGQGPISEATSDQAGGEEPAVTTERPKEHGPVEGRVDFSGLGSLVE